LWNISDALGGTDLSAVIARVSTTPAEDYFNGKVLQYYKGNNATIRYTWSDYGSVQWELVLCLLLTWTVVCLILIKGKL